MEEADARAANKKGVSASTTPPGPMVRAPIEFRDEDGGGLAGSSVNKFPNHDVEGSSSPEPRSGSADLAESAGEPEAAARTPVRDRLAGMGGVEKGSNDLLTEDVGVLVKRFAASSA